MFELSKVFIQGTKKRKYFTGTERLSFNPLAAAAVKKKNVSFFAACFFLCMYFFADNEISRF